MSKSTGSASFGEEVRCLATHLQDIGFTIITTRSEEEPEHGAEYILASLEDLKPRLVALRAKLRRSRVGAVR